MICLQVLQQETILGVCQVQGFYEIDFYIFPQQKITLNGEIGKTSKDGKIGETSCFANQKNCEMAKFSPFRQLMESIVPSRHITKLSAHISN